MENHYKTLGLEPGASQDEIKRAYRKLAMKWHPDRNSKDRGAEEKFKEIKLAYEILNNPDKKKEYDYELYSKTKKQNFNTSGFEDIDDIMSKFMNDSFFHEFNNAFGFGKNSYVLNFEINISFWEAVFGGEHVFSIAFQNGRVAENKTVRIVLPQACEDGDVLGVVVDGIQMQVVLRVVPDEKFKRNHLDLFTTIDIPFTTAALGGEVIFPHWTGDLKIKVSPGIQPHEKICVANGGVRKGVFVGDLYLSCQIFVPKKVNERQREILEEFRKTETKLGDGWFSGLKEVWKKFSKNK